MILCAVAGVCEILQQFLLFALRGSAKKENCPETVGAA